MSARELKHLLDQVDDTWELVIRRPAPAGPSWSPVKDAWREAHADARDALGAWLSTGGGADYAAYRAAQDREDAAQDALVLSAG